MAYPKRIVCLTEETVETLYLLGEQDRIVGVSGFVVRPKEAREKPRVSAFIDANFDKIAALEPDLVLGFSDLQADIAAELIRQGRNVMVFNQRSIDEILSTIVLIGALVGRASEAEVLSGRLRKNLDEIAAASSRQSHRPRVFFEEWHEPLISGIRWCSELVEVCGGIDVCVETRSQQGAKGRIFMPETIAQRDPECVIASWCGRKASRAKIVARPGWGNVSAVRNDQLYEIKSAYILQPGPASLTDGVTQMAAIVAAVARGDKLPKKRQVDLRQSASRSSCSGPSLGRVR